jgi:hypothetical protein
LSLRFGEISGVTARHGSCNVSAAGQAARGAMNFCTGFCFLAVQRSAAAMAAGPMARYWLASVGCWT